MVDAKLVEQRRVQVGNADRVDGGLVTKLIAGVVDVALLESAASQEQAEAVAIMVAPFAFCVTGKRLNSPVRITIVSSRIPAISNP